MNVIRLGDVSGTEREVHCPKGGFISLRYLLASEGVGFSLHKTVVPRGEPQSWKYNHHVEACYCVSGTGVLVNETTGESWMIEPDTLYVVRKGEAHQFRAVTDVVLISVFNPPLAGRETHDSEGSYPKPREEQRSLFSLPGWQF